MTATALLLVLATQRSPAELTPNAVQVLAAHAAHFVTAGGVHIVPCPPARELRRRHAPQLSRTSWARATIELRAAGLLHTAHLGGRWITGALLPRSLPELRPWAWAVPHVGSSLPGVVT